MNTLRKYLLGIFARPWALVAVLALASPVAAQAQSTTYCGEGVKADVVKALEGSAQMGAAELAKLEAALYDKYKTCGTVDAAQVLPTDPIFVAARQCGAKVSILGSLFYEEMSCCGYDPQRRSFACPVKIKQRFGFGGSPLPGSREFMLHCVADAAGVLHEVAHDSVHLSNSQFNPTWQFAVIASANERLNLVQPMSGQPRRARSILSWNLRPTGCNYVPIWGNALDYTIRLDQ